MSNSTNQNAYISLIDVTKVFRLGILKKKTAVSELTLDIDEGKLVGLLGPNGSGKSTTLKMMLGFLKPTSGQILVCGHPSNNKTARSFIGYLPENPRFQKFLTGYETLFYFGKLLGIRTKKLRTRVDELFELVSLTHATKERVQGYSKGMTQRLAIAGALLNQPPVLVFDEPMSGLDPIGRMEIRQLIQQIHRNNPRTTIFFSTHILGDVEELCSHVALLRQGKLALYCPIDELLLKNEERYDVTLHNVKPELQQELISQNKGSLTPAGLTLTMEGTDELIQKLGEFRAAGANVLKVSSHRQSLERALFTDPIGNEPQPQKEVTP